MILRALRFRMGQYDILFDFTFTIWQIGFDIRIFEVEIRLLSQKKNKIKFASAIFRRVSLPSAEYVFE